MTPTEHWILGLVLVYSVPAFMAGIGATLLFLRWRRVLSAAAMTPRFLSPERMFERDDLQDARTGPTDKGQGMRAQGLRLL
jgi:hypothetical protein